jgi:hypothetical protein
VIKPEGVYCCEKNKRDESFLPLRAIYVRFDNSKKKFTYFSRAKKEKVKYHNN